jgi:hypothetical protein
VKKTLGSLLCMLVVTVLMASTVSALTLKQYTQYTYVKHTEDPSGRFYEGLVGVRGADWIKYGGYWCWPKYSKITYFVPLYPPATMKVTADDEHDETVRTGKIRVNDNILPLKKTEVFWDIDLRKKVFPGDPPDGIQK